MRTLVRVEPWGRWSVTGLGVLLCGVIVGVVALRHPEWTTLHHLQIGIPILLALGLAVYGGWLVRSDLSPERIRRIALWSLAGAVLLGTFASWEAYTHILDGAPFVETLHEPLLGMAEGATVGALVGHYDARRKDQYLEAEQARQAVSASMDGMAILDEDGEYRVVNQAHAEVYGYDDPNTFIGETWHLCYTEEEAARVEEEVFPHLDEEGRWRGELTGKRRDGSTFPQEVTLSTRPTGGLVCVVRDVTERHEYEDRLKALNETSRELMVAESEDAIAEIVVDTAYRLFDQPLSALWSYDADEDVLVPVAAAEPAEGFAEAANPLEGIPPLPAGTAEMEIFRGGESTVIENYQEIDNPANPDIPLGTLLVVPLGDRAQLNIGSPVVEDIGRSDRQLVEILCRNARTALDRVERERTLANREQRLSTIVENVPVILFAINRNRELTLRVGKGLDQVGVDQNEMVGETVDELFDRSPAIIDAVDRSLDGEPVDVTIGIWGRTYHVWYQPVVEDGETTSVIGVAMDITERHRRERGIRALHDATREMTQEADREAICRIAVETAQNALGLPLSAIWLRADDRPRLDPVAWSDQVEELFDEIPVFEPGNSISWQVYEEGEPRVFEDVSGAEARSNPETEIRSELIVPIGDYGVLNSGSIEPGQFDETDVVLAQLLAANTRAALERADREEALQHQTDQMEFFNSILRHDVLNGMTVIRARAEFLTDELDGEQLKDAETIVDWSDNVTAIIQRVRTVLDTLTGTGDPQLEPVDLSGALRTEVDRIRTTYPEVEFETDIPDGVTVRANELLGEVLGNVITNAVSHNDTEGLRVSVTVDDGRDEPDDPVTVRIADNGRGVPDDIKETIFRRDETGHVKSTGSGFGLFFVDAMVAEYGGDVRVEDSEPQGAEFVIEFPPP
jgi:PAS domain S-box-containing protein